MIKYINESDEIEMDVQVGPQEEKQVSVAPEEAVPKSPVDLAKAEPKNVPVACKKDKEGCCEFFVDARDLEKYADLTEQTMLGALNSVIKENAESEMAANNITVVLGESTANYARNLEKHGAAYIICKEAEGDIEMDVQVGPNEEDIQVKEDPQTANPVDAVKREYDNVVVAKQGDEFFVDVEDVQKCAELNCESVISCLNNIIKVNEASDMSADKLVVLVHEFSTPQEVVDVLEQAGAEIGIVHEAKFSFLPKFKEDPETKELYAACKEAEELLAKEGIESKAGAEKFGKVALRILDIIRNADSILAIPLSIFNPLVGIPCYLIDRLWSWGLRAGQEAIVRSYTSKCITAYGKILKEEKDPKAKKAINDKIAHLEEKLKAMNEKDS